MITIQKNKNTSQVKKEHKPKRLRIKRVVKKVQKKAIIAFRIWRVFAATTLFIIITPTFLAANDTEHFFITMFSLTALICGLAFILKQPLGKGLQRYVTRGIFFLLIGATILLVEGIMQVFVPNPVVQIALLVGSSLGYAFGIQRLGLGIIVGVM